MVHSMTIVYELRNPEGELIAREFSERKICDLRMRLENRNGIILRMSKLFVQKDDMAKRDIQSLNKYKHRYKDFYYKRVV